MNIYAIAAEEAAQDEGEADPNGYATDPNLTSARSHSQTSRTVDRSLHRNRAVVHELQDERRRRYECDRNEEMLLARFEDLKDLPYKAPTAPSPNGSVFSNEEITTAAARQRNIEAALYILS